MMTPGQLFTVLVLFPIGLLLAFLLSQKTEAERAFENTGSRPGALPDATKRGEAQLTAATAGGGEIKPSMGSVRPPPVAAAAKTPSVPSPGAPPRAVGSSMFPPPMEPASGPLTVPKEPALPTFLGGEYIDDDFSPATVLTTRLNEQSIASLVAAVDSSPWSAVSERIATDAPALDVGARTDMGLRRDRNADQVLCRPEKRLFAVVDGSGSAGAIASELVVEALYEAGQRDNAVDESYERQLVRALERAHQRVLEFATSGGPSDVGASALASYCPFDERRIYFAHVGTCRAYRVRNRSIDRLTTDHAVERSTETGSIAIKVTRTIGSGARFETETGFDTPTPGDVYLLCTDGLWRMLSDEEMYEVIAEGGRADEIASELIAAANARGGKDNIAVIVLRFN